MTENTLYIVLNLDKLLLISCRAEVDFPNRHFCSCTQIFSKIPVTQLVSVSFLYCMLAYSMISFSEMRKSRVQTSPGICFCYFLGVLVELEVLLFGPRCTVPRGISVKVRRFSTLGMGIRIPVLLPYSHKQSVAIVVCGGKIKVHCAINLTS